MNLTALVGLLFPVLLGLMAGGIGLFPDANRAIEVLNRYALYVAFPALVFAGIADASFDLPTNRWFWLIPGLALAISLAPLWWRRSRMGAKAGTIAHTTAFGNVAYLGLPVVERVFGEQVLGLASLVLAQHVVLALLVGPFLLLRWGGGKAGSFEALGRVIRQPLLWAPFAAMLARQGAAGGLLQGLMAPIGRSAAPVALFLLGLYLWVNRGRLVEVGQWDVVHVAYKLLVLPAITLVLVGLARLFGLDLVSVQVLLILAAMPTAITTFSLAHDLGVGEETVARTIVLSTVLSMLTVPMWVFLSGA